MCTQCNAYLADAHNNIHIHMYISFCTFYGLHSHMCKTDSKRCVVCTGLVWSHSESPSGTCQHNMNIPFVLLVSNCATVTPTLAAPRLHGLPKEYRTKSDVPGRSNKHFLESRVSIACAVSLTETSGCVCICASGSIHRRFCPAEQKGTSICKVCLASDHTSVLTPSH